MRILVIGDSWAAGFNATTQKEDGWPEIMKIEADMRQAVSGSTAKQWAEDFGGRLTKAINTPADVLIMSLSGNDIFVAMSDGSISVTEFLAIGQNIRKVLDVVQKPRTIVMLYASTTHEKECLTLNYFIRSLLKYKEESLDTSEFLTAKHFTGPDIHPNETGHKVIAQHLTAMLAPAELST